MAEFAKTVPRLTGSVFLVQASDHKDGRSAALRTDFLEQHLHYVEKNCEKYLVCGPCWPPGETEIDGSFFLVNADDEQAARALVEGDPYVAAGTYAEISVRQVSVAAGQFIGGVIWESAESVRQFAAKPRTSEN